MSKYKINTKGIIDDFLNDRLSDQDRRTFLKLYISVIKEDREEAGLIFEDIQRQIDALSEIELQVFFTKLDASNSTSKNSKIISFKNITPYLKYAVAIAIIVSFVFLYAKVFLGEEKAISYFANANKLLWLPDSSTVFLKAGSRLSFDSSYGKESRLVTLDGEAFFEVKPDKEKAFIVSSRLGFYSKVLGTSFLMSTAEQFNKVEVKTGKVQVGFENTMYAVLLAGDTLLKDNNNNVIVNRKEQHPFQDLIQFENASLEKIIAELMVKFNQEIILDKSVPTGLKYTATFSTAQNLEDVLKVLCDLHQLKYKIKTNEIVIYK